MIAIIRHPSAPPPRASTLCTVTDWIARLVAKAKMNRADPICTRSPALRVTSAVRAE